MTTKMAMLVNCEDDGDEDDNAGDDDTDDNYAQENDF